MKGEFITDDTTWIVKTHHPGFMLYSVPFTVNKVLYIVRNPYDSFISYASLVLTMNHSVKPKFVLHEEYPEWWNDFITV